MIIKIIEELSNYIDLADRDEVNKALQQLAVDPHKFASEYLEMLRGYSLIIEALNSGEIDSSQEKVASEYAASLVKSLIDYTAALNKIAQEGGYEGSQAVADLLNYVQTLNMEKNIEEATKNTLEASAEIFDNTQKLSSVVAPEIIEIIKQLTGYNDVIVAKVLNIYSKLMVPIYAELQEAIPLIFELTMAKITDLGLQALNEVSPLLGHEDYLVQLDSEVQDIIAKYSSGASSS